jgi:hypothetical protein
VYNLSKQGIHVHEEYKIIVAFTRVTDASYHYNQNYLQKNYEADCSVLPFNVLMRKRDPDHYMNINQRILNPISALTIGK